MVKKSTSIKETHRGWCCWCCHGSSAVFWGLLLLILGLWFLARDLGLISFSVSTWAVVLIFIGIWILIKRNKKTC